MKAGEVEPMEADMAGEVEPMEADVSGQLASQRNIGYR